MFEWFKNCYQWYFDSSQNEHQSLIIDEEQMAEDSRYDSIRDIHFSFYNWCFKKNTFSKTLETRLLDSPKTKTGKTATFLKKFIFQDILAIANTYGLAFAVSLFERVLNACDPENPSDAECTAQINMRAGYIGLSIAGFDFIFRVIINTLMQEKPKKTVLQLWEITKDIIGKYGFSLQFTLFFHTQIALLVDAINKKNDNGNAKVVTSNAIFIAEGIAAGIVAFFGNDLVRKMIDKKSIHINDPLTEDDREKWKKISDAGFSAFFGFALGRGTGDTIRAMSGKKDSLPWMIARYANGFVFYTLTAILALKKDPTASFNKKTNFERVLMYMVQLLTILFFGTVLIENMTKNNPADRIQSISIIVLTVLAAAYSLYMTLHQQNSNNDLIEVEDQKNNNRPSPTASADFTSKLILDETEEDVEQMNDQITIPLSPGNLQSKNNSSKKASQIDKLFLNALRPQCNFFKNNNPYSTDKPSNDFKVPRTF